MNSPGNSSSGDSSSDGEFPEWEIEISAGEDIIESMAEIAGQMGVAGHVFSGIGHVSEATLYQDEFLIDVAVDYTGFFEIRALWGAIPDGDFDVWLADVNRLLSGRAVRLIAATRVKVSAFLVPGPGPAPGAAPAE